ncbi:MAG: hypothetical protein WA885_00430 [Phormidesmis sp.]
METLLIFVYTIVVFYVLYQMALGLEDALENKVFINLDEDFAAEQTQMQLSSQSYASHIEAQIEKINFSIIPDKPMVFSVFALVFDEGKTYAMNDPRIQSLKESGMSPENIRETLKKRISIRVSPTKKQKLRQVRYLSLDVENKTADMQIHLDWDYSSLEMYGQGNRIIRSTANMARDLSQAQIFGLVNPGQSVHFDLNIEKNYTRDPETGDLRQPLPLVDLEAIVAQSQLTDPTKEEKNIQPLYGLDLMVRLKRPSESNDKMINLLVPFAFTLEIEPDQPAFPPIRWLLRNFGRRSRREEGSWLWGTRKRA